MRTATIMQPTYLPWLGYFDLIDQSDIFVLLDSVQFDRRSWQQRNRIKTPAGELFLTVPVFSRGQRDQKIDQVQLDDSSGFAEKHLKALEHNYGRAPYYGACIEGLSGVLRRGHSHLADLNYDLILWLCEATGIGTEIIRSSTLPVTGDRVALLVDVCKKVGADAYLSPAGARGYIEQDNLFPGNNVALRYQAYTHPVYTQQHGDFLPYMSVIDLLFNVGDGALTVIRSGRNAAATPA